MRDPDPSPFRLMGSVWLSLSQGRQLATRFASSVHDEMRDHVPEFLIFTVGHLLKWPLSPAYFITD
jgi:hypothetical protein